MSLKIFQSTPYDYTHEREQFEKLCNICIECFSKTEEPNLLFGNPCLNGAHIDALFIKRDAIVIIEFKNYGGHIKVSENGDWTLSDGTIVKGGGAQNPYQQTCNNKYNGVMAYFNEFFAKGYVNLGHVSGFVVFNQDIIIDINNISEKSKSWFGVTDMSHIASVLKNRTSPQIRYTEKDMEEIPRICDYNELRHMIYPSIDDFIDELEEEVADSRVVDAVKDFTDEDPAEFITEISSIRQKYEYNGGIYEGGLDKDGLPDGEGKFTRKKYCYEGCFKHGEPDEEAQFKVTSLGTKFQRIYNGTIKKDYSFNKGHLTVSNPEGDEKKEYIGIFEGMNLKEGKYLKNGILRAEGQCTIVATSDGRKALSFVPQTGHSQVSDYMLSNGSYTGLLDANGRPDDNQGVLIDRRGNKFVGPFVHGLKNGKFSVFIRNRSVARRIEYKDDIEVNILDD